MSRRHSSGRERPAVKAAVAVAVVAAVAAGAGVLTRTHYRAKAGSTEKALAVEAGAVRAVVVADKAHRVELTRTGDGQWQGATPATRTLMLSAEDELFPLRAFRALSLDPADPQLGLADPDITFEVQDGGGERHRVAFGAPTFTDGGFYAHDPGQGRRVYLVPKRMVYDLRSVLAGNRIDPPNDIPGKVRDANDKAREESEQHEVSYWLQQSLDAGTPVPDELR
jgi:hypothetical protein